MCSSDLSAWLGTAGFFGAGVNTVVPNRDELGRPWTKESDKDPVIKEMARLGFEEYKGEKLKGETREAFDKRISEAADRVHVYLADIMKQPSYTDLPRTLKIKFIKKTISQFMSSDPAVQKQNANEREAERLQILDEQKRGVK